MLRASPSSKVLERPLPSVFEALNSIQNRETAAVYEREIRKEKQKVKRKKEIDKGREGGVARTLPLQFSGL